jgi:hypothetical protein
MNSVLYCQGTFDIPNPDSTQTQAMKAAAIDIASAGFSCVILGQWHVQPDGSIYYNNTEVADVAATLAWLPGAFKEAGVQQVLVSFGPFGSDFANIINPANLENFKTTIAALLTSCSIDGIDWDLEQDLTPANASALAGLVDWGTSQSFLVTADPYYAQSEFWNAAQQQSQQGFAWWNVQMYSSQTNIDEYAQWVEGVTRIVSDPQSFILPGYSVAAANGDPGSITRMLQADLSNAPRLDGAMLWKYEFIVAEGKGTLQDYVQAIQAGVSSSI